MAHITHWLDTVRNLMGGDYALALELIRCRRLVKGYSDTHKRGRANFNRIFDMLVDGTAVAGDDARAKAIFAAREAALADPEGKNLDASLGRLGITPRPLREQPIKFIKPKLQNRV